MHWRDHGAERQPEQPQPGADIAVTEPGHQVRQSLPLQMRDSIRRSCCEAKIASWQLISTITMLHQHMVLWPGQEINILQP